jgi:hypothetical protein
VARSDLAESLWQRISTDSILQLAAVDNQIDNPKKPWKPGLQIRLSGRVRSEIICLYYPIGYTEVSEEIGLETRRLRDNNSHSYDCRRLLPYLQYITD